MSPKRRILLNIVATYGRSLYTLFVGLFTARGCGSWRAHTLVDLQIGRLRRVAMRIC